MCVLAKTGKREELVELLSTEPRKCLLASSQLRYAEIRKKTEKCGTLLSLLPDLCIT